MCSELQPRLELFHYPAAWGQAPHVDGIDALSIILAGRIRERSGRVERLSGAGQVVIKPADAVHETWFVEDTVVLRLEHPHLFGRRAGIPWHWSTSPQVAAGFMAAIEQLQGGSAAAALDALRDLATAGCRAVDAPIRAAPQWLLRAHEELADRAHLGVTVAEVAARAGVHPVYLAKAYRLHFGLAPTESLQRARLGRAIRAAVLEGESLSRAAAVGGLSDQSHLTRSCRRFLGLTPARATGQAGPPFPKVASVQSPRMRVLYPPLVAPDP